MTRVTKILIKELLKLKCQNDDDKKEFILYGALIANVKFS